MPASAAVDECAARLDSRFGVVPLALQSWVRLVGDVWLVGTDPEWPESASADPLIVEIEGSHYPTSDLRSYFSSAYTHLQKVLPSERRNDFVLPISPDRLHKENVSGGEPYGVIVPDASAEGYFAAERTVPFVSYLIWVFSHGGFPEHTGTRV